MLQIPIEEIVPHSKSMCLLSQLEDYGDEWLKASVTLHSESMFANEEGVPSWVGLEYMAQTVAAFAGLRRRLAGEPPKVGYLLGTRKYDCNTDLFPLGSCIETFVQLELEGENGLASYRCELTGNSIKATARINVYQPTEEQQQKGVE